MKNLLTSGIKIENEKIGFIKKTFGITAIGFLIICLIGYIVSFAIDSSGVLKEALKNQKQFDVSFYNKISLANAMGRLAKVSVFGIALILLSGILNLVWAFRVLKASKTFILITFAIYTIAQGLGFGILFTTLKARDLLAIFGISGSIFFVMAAIGFLSKNLMPLGKLLIIGTIFSIFLMAIVWILILTGAISSNSRTLNIAYSFVGLITIGWIAFDVWRIKKHVEFAKAINHYDEDTEFRLAMWFGFRLLTHFVTLVWVVIRFYYFSRN